MRTTILHGVIFSTLTMAATLVGYTPAARAQGTSAGPIGRLVHRLRHHQQPTTTWNAAAAAPAAVAQQPAAACDCSGSDPYGFASVLNRLRAAAGLHPLAYDADLSSWASQNNAAQCRRGIGHHVNPGCFQNCGWNHSSAEDVARGWMNSPGHRENLLSPSVSRFGIAYGPGPYWTLNAR
ncbi:Cysteine-rich secretory protein family protein [Aquisphaera giovannonii]|uniref:Cysteine-rich secretory protein family protein n=1 Tax=Aquisphaera giovannonii TaxID=406548 RepID=A0A5B9WDI7_9BACT|nr:CAP domain-containing protein [Aquisphaera giovannonii]QEH38686.1 Cysteine-rich secretory protein family protein [Aquisphaera giovannonii]